MDRYLLDTNIISELMKAEGAGDDSIPSLRLIEKMGSIAETGQLLTSVVVIAEIDYGIHINPASSVLLKKAKSVMNRFELLPVNEHVAMKYSQLRGRLFEKYAPKEKRKILKRTEEWIDPTTSKELGIQENDVWITATALCYGLVLVTHDKKMKRIFDALDEKLTIEDWLEL
jgi:tRNA(fMet)-specific endonuclease VapC